ncbi:MAG: glycogen/starch/alpha-glucan phosphorylase [Burkholderiaceae bacterium]|nr:glycogen/starch/alpha-glucan phosphorylase [Burkholderiaceae bacterium]
MFGHRRTGSQAGCARSGYQPRLHHEQNPHLQAVLDADRRRCLQPGEPQRYRALVDDAAATSTAYLLLADFASYCAMPGAGRRPAIADPAAWADKAIRNIAGMGAFSADRTIRAYARDIWHVDAR